MLIIKCIKYFEIYKTLGNTIDTYKYTYKCCRKLCINIKRKKKL